MEMPQINICSLTQQMSREQAHQIKKDLRDGIHTIMLAGLDGAVLPGLQENMQQPMTRQKYMQMYTLVHTFCTSLEGCTYSRRRTESLRVGEELYRIAESQLHASCQHCRWLLARSSDPVEAYGSVFKRYLFNVKVRQLRHYFGPIDWRLMLHPIHYVTPDSRLQVVDKLLAYLNRHWVPRSREDNGESIERLAFGILQLGMVLWRDIVLRGSDGIMVRLARAVATASPDYSPAAEASLCGSIADVLSTHGELGESLGRVPGGSTVRESQGALDGLPVYYAGSRCPYWTRLVHRQCSRKVKDTALTLKLVAYALLNRPNDPNVSHSPQLPRTLDLGLILTVSRSPAFASVTAPQTACGMLFSVSIGLVGC